MDAAAAMAAAPSLAMASGSIVLLSVTSLCVSILVRTEDQVPGQSRHVLRKS